MDNSELRAIDRAVEALYASIGFERGGSPDLTQLRQLFVEGGLLINNNEDTLVMTVDQFIEAFQQQLSSGALQAFSEREVASHTEIFGRVAQRFSTYEARFDPTAAEPDVVGINSVQLVKVGEQWRVSSLAWNDQTEGRSIPERYLEAPG
jgi:hypothetical protein